MSLGVRGDKKGFAQVIPVFFFVPFSWEKFATLYSSSPIYFSVVSIMLFSHYTNYVIHSLAC